jgi:hypothetical protein
VIGFGQSTVMTSFEKKKIYIYIPYPLADLKFSQHRISFVTLPFWDYAKINKRIFKSSSLIRRA